MSVFDLVMNIVLCIIGLIPFCYGIYLFISKNINAIVLIQHERVEEGNIKAFVKGVGLGYIVMSSGYIIAPLVSIFSGWSFGTSMALICAATTGIIGHLVIRALGKKYNS